MRWAGHVAHMRDMKNVFNILVGKPEGKRQRGTLRCVYYRRIILKWILGKSILILSRDQWRMGS
jgi:hypothetical protein